MVSHSHLWNHKLVQFLHHPITQCSQQSRHFMDIYRIKCHWMTTLLAPSQFTITLKSARPHTQALQQPQMLCRSCCSHLEVNQTQSSKDAKTKSFKAVSSLFILQFQKNFLFFKVQDQPHLLLITEKLREQNTPWNVASWLYHRLYHMIICHRIFMPTPWNIHLPACSWSSQYTLIVLYKFS